MSTTIDDRVVEMRFDNGDFEQNVNQTLSTLDKLKLALNLPGATKGLDDVSAAAAKCDLGPLGSAVEMVSNKFSALDVIAFTALQNITNRVMDAGSRILREFTIEPISTGFNEYELKMGSVQTIMASTGESIDTVNKYLEELNKYSDQTIYSFSDMTNNIGKFTNAGVNLKDAVAAIKGVSNEAAVSGATANEASHAMYNFAQALSAGYVKLIDWKSIENANMATVEFKDELLKTAVAVGTVAEAEDGMFHILSTNAKGSTMDDVVDATHNFNDSLSFQWMTTEVLTQTLAKYADETTDLGKKAFAAAQDVKTFSMMMDTLKEAAQSGWAMTWETVIGDFEEAKVVFTDLSELLSGVIGAFDDARNNFLRGGLASSWKQLTDQITQSGVGMNDFEEALVKVVDSHGGDYTQIIKDNKNLATAIQNGSVKATWLRDAYHELAKGAKDAKDETTGLAKYTDEELKSIKLLDNEMFKLKGHTFDLLHTLTRESGRQYLFEMLKNPLEGLIKLTSTFVHAWRDAVPSLFTSERLYKALEFFGKFSRHLVMSDETADKLRRTLRGLFAPLGMISAVLQKIGGTALSIIGKVLGLGGKIKLNILDFTAQIGDVLYGFEQWLISTEGLGKYWAKFETKLFSGLRTVKQYINAFLEIPQVKSAIDTVKTSLNDFASDIPGNLKAAALAFKDFAVNVYNNVKDYIDTIRNIPRVQQAITNFKEILTKFAADVPDLLKEGADRLKAFIKYVKSLDGLSIENIKSALKFFGKSAEWYFSEILDKLTGVRRSFNELVFYILGEFLDKMGETGKKLKSYAENLKAAALAIKDFVIEHKGVLIAIAASVGMIVFIRKIGKALTQLAKPLFDVSGFLDSVGGAISKIADGIAKREKAEAMKNYAIAIAILAGSLLVLSRISVPDLLKAVAAIAVLAGVLVVLSFAMSKFGGAGVKGGAASAVKSTTLLAIAGSLIILVEALKELDSIEHPENMIRNLFYLGVLAVGLIAVVKILNGGKGVLKDAKAATSAFQMLAIATALKILVSSLDEIGQYNLKTMGKSLVLLVGIAVALRLVMTSLKGIGPGGGFSAIAAVLSLMLLVKAFKQIADLDVSKAKDNLKAFVVIFGIYAGLMAASKLAGKHAASAGVGIFLMASSLIVLALAIRMLAGMSASDISKGTDAIKGIFAAFAVVIAASMFSGKYAVRAGIMIAAMSAAMILLTGAIAILAQLDPGGLDRAVDAIETLIKCFAILIAASSVASKATSTIVVITVAVGMLAIAIAGLSMIPEDQLKGAVNAMSQIMIILGVVMLLSKYAGGDFKSLLSIVAAIGMIGLVLIAMKDIDPKNAIANATAISGVLLALSASLKIIDGTKGISKNAVGTLATMVLVVGAIALIFGLLDHFDVSASLQTATAISEVLLALSVSLRIISNTKQLSGETYTTLAVMVGIIALIGVVIGALCQVPNIDQALTIATSLSEVVLALSAACLIISVAGKISKGAQAGILTLVEMVAVIGTFMGLVGGLMTLFPEAEEFLRRGIDVLNQIASGIGEFVGNLVHGFISGLTGVDSLSQIGDELSAFMDSLQPFLDASKDLDDSVLKGIGTLVACIAAVTAADALNGFRNLPIIRKVMGTGSMSQFGQELADFAGPFKEFITTFDDAGVSMDTVETAANAIKAVAEFADAIPNQGGLLSKLVGDNTLSSFGEELAAFGPKFAEFAGSISDVKGDTVTAASEAATAVAEFAKIVPNSGGKLAGLIGDNTLDKFGEELAAFGPKFAEYVSSVSGITGDSTEASSQAATIVAEFASKIPNSGGKLSEWIGDNSLSSFAEELAAFGPAFAEYVDSVSGIGADATAASTAAATTVSAFAANLSSTNPSKLATWLSGKSTLSSFGGELEAFGSKFAGYYDSIKEITPGPINASISAAERVIAMTNGDLPDKGNVKTIGESMTTLSKDFVKFYKDIQDMDPGKVNSFASLIRTVAGLATEIEAINADSFSNFGQALQSLGEADISAFSTGIENEIPNVEAAVSGMMTTFHSKISEQSPLILESFTTMFSQMEETLNGKTELFTTTAQGMMDGFANGLTAGRNRMALIISSMMSEIVASVDNGKKEFVSLGNDCMQRLAEGLVAGKANVLSNTKSVVESAKLSISSNNGNFQVIGANLVKSFGTGISSGGTNVRTIFGQIVATLASTANSYRASMQTAGSTLMANFITGFTSKASNIKTGLTSQLSATVIAAIGYVGAFRSAGASLVSSLASGIKSVSISALFTAPLYSALYTINSYRGTFYDAGANLVRGFANGISDYAYIARNAATALGHSTASALKNAVKEKSPSKLTHQYGQYFSEGFANGIREYSKLADIASEKMGSSSAETLQKTLSNLNDLVADNIDAQPTIRPVVDLSNVQAGVGEINGMLDSTRSVQLGYSGIITDKLADTNNALSQQEQLRILRGMSALMDRYFPQFSENGDVYLDSNVIAGTVNRKLGLQT